MKTFKLIELSVVFCALLSLLSCNEIEIFVSKEWDVNPVNVNIYIYDQDGNNLLNKSYGGNLTTSPIAISYDGEQYQLGETVEESRAYKPFFSGLQLLDQSDYYDAHMQFGEFEGAESYTMSMTLNICNNESYDIKVVRDFKWSFTGEPKGKTTYYLDDKQVDGSDIFITTTNNYASMEWDYAPVVITMAVVDAEGNDLLNLDTEGNVLGEEISIAYNGERYFLNEGGQLAASRALPTLFEGLTISNRFDKNWLLFGEFEGNQDYDMTLKLKIGDENYVMRYVRDFEHPDLSKQPLVEEERYLDNHVVKEQTFTIKM